MIVARRILIAEGDSMELKEAVRLIWIILLGVPTVALLAVSLYMWITYRPEPIADYPTNHPNRKGY